MANEEKHSECEERADRAQKIIEQFSDCNYRDCDPPAEGAELDISDVIADLFHLCDRYGLSRDDVLFRAQSSYDYDPEPPCQEDPWLSGHEGEEDGTNEDDS